MLKTCLHICPTKERARDVVRNAEGNHFVEALTLPRFIDDAHQRLTGDTFSPDSDDALLLLMDVAAKTPLTHFTRLGQTPEDVLATASGIVDLFHLVKANGGSHLIGRLGHHEAKTADLITLYEAYETEKGEQGVTDAAGRARFVSERISDAAKDYHHIVCDPFEMHGVHLWGSFAEKDVLDALGGLPNAETAPPPTTASRPNITHQKAVTRTDEVEKAALIVTSLLLDGVKPADIVIAAGQVRPYLHTLPAVFSRRGIPVFLSRGIPVRQTPAWQICDTAMARRGSLADADAAIGAYLTRLTDMTQADGREHDIALAIAAAGKLRTTIRRLIATGRTFVRPSMFLEHVADGLTVFAPSPGIRVQELNQLVFRNLEHVVLIGADDALLPKRPPSSMLVTGRQLESVFDQNNTHDLSAMHVHALMNAARHLHIVSASTDNRRPLEPSLLLIDAIDNLDACPAYPIRDDAFDGVSLLSKPNANARTRIDDMGELFIASAASPEHTAFDGVMGGPPPKSPSYLSASTIKDYVSCPLKYLYDRLLNLKGPEDEADGFDMMQAGSLMHLVFERFTEHVKAHPGAMEKTLSPNTKKLMYGIARKAFDDFMTKEYGKSAGTRKNIHHTVTFDDITAGLINDEAPGLAQKFLMDVYDRFGGAAYPDRVHAVEHHIDPAVHTIKDIPIRGAIDRIDITDDEIRLIDYKSKRKNRTSAVKEANAAITELTDVQLLIYLDYAQRHLSVTRKDIVATLTSYHYDEPDFAHVSLTDDGAVTLKDHKGKNLETTGLMEHLSQTVTNTWEGITAGNFGFTPSDDACMYCPVEKLCHKDSRNKTAAQPDDDDGGEE